MTDARENRATPNPGEVWRHHKGGVYRVVMLGWLEATRDPAVVYAASDGTVWIRSLANFMERVDEQGTPRFAKEAPHD